MSPGIAATLLTIALGLFIGGGPALGADGEFYAAAGKIAPTGGGDITGTAAIGYRTAKYDFMATYAAPSEVYDDAPVPGFAMLSVSRVFTFKARRWGTPVALVGLSLKGADRCAYNGEVECNRRLPLPVNFHFGVGIEWPAFRLELYHDSNNALDSGPEKKNLGLNWLTLQYRVK